MLKIDKNSFLYGVLLVIIVILISSLLYKPNNDTYAKLDRLISTPVSGIRNPDDISKRTIGSGVMYLEYEYVDYKDMLYKVISNIDSEKEWYELKSSEDKISDSSRKYCRPDYILFVSVYKRDLKVVVEEDLYNQCRNP